MFAGHDTTATNMSFSLYLLGRHKEAQWRCQEELDIIFQVVREAQGGTEEVPGGTRHHIPGRKGGTRRHRGGARRT